jgi:RsmE family RNA methyltransferase
LFPFFVFAVGPEGGWVPPEVEIFKQAGFLPFHIGDKILRTETAVVSLLSQSCLVKSSMAVLAQAFGVKRLKMSE